MAQPRLCTAVDAWIAQRPRTKLATAVGAGAAAALHRRGPWIRKGAGEGDGCAAAALHRPLDPKGSGGGGRMNATQVGRSGGTGRHVSHPLKARNRWNDLSALKIN